MEIKNYNVYFFVLVLIVITFLVFLILQPFLSSIMMAAILAITFHGLYKFFLKITKDRSSLSSFLTCIMILLIIILPVIVIFNLLVNETTQLYHEVSKDENFYQNYVNNTIDNVANSPVMQSFDLDGVINEWKIGQSAQRIGQWFIIGVQKAYQNMISFAIWIFVMFFSLYYFLIEGGNILKRVMYLSPLKDEHERKLSGKFVSMTKATLKGTVVVGTIQGVLGGIMFAIAGVPSFIVWGVVMIVLSIIPAIGSGIVWAPAGIIMLIAGNIWQGIFILVFGGIFISFIDNILRPKLVGSDTEMHPLLVFFATLGGLISFGIIGFIIGPVIMVLFLTLWDIYGVEFKEQLERLNNRA